MADSELKAAFNALVEVSEPVTTTTTEAAVPTETTTTATAVVPTQETTVPPTSEQPASSAPSEGVKASKYGDVDLNGMIELADVTKLSKYLLNKATFPLDSEIAFKNADITHDEKVDILDLSKLLEFNVGNPENNNNTGSTGYYSNDTSPEYR